MVTRRSKYIYNADPKRGAGWHVHVRDDDIDGNSAAVFLTEQNTGFTEMAGADIIRVKSSTTDITQTVTVNGIESGGGKKIREDIALNGATEVESSSALWRLVDWLELDAVCAGTITVERKTSAVALQTITIGQMRSYTAKHFNGEYKSVITNFRAGLTDTTGNGLFELRFYPSDTGGTTTPTAAYEVLETIFIDKTATSPYNVPNVIPPGCGIEVPAGGYIAVWCKSGADDTKGYITIDGYDIT